MKEFKIELDEVEVELTLRALQLRLYTSFDTERAMIENLITEIELDRDKMIESGLFKG